MFKQIHIFQCSNDWNNLIVISNSVIYDFFFYLLCLALYDPRANGKKNSPADYVPRGACIENQL